jgi:hypothetical protein
MVRVAISSLYFISHLLQPFEVSWKYSIIWQQQEVAWKYRLLKEDLLTMTRDLFYEAHSLIFHKSLIILHQSIPFFDLAPFLNVDVHVPVEQRDNIK